MDRRKRHMVDTTRFKWFEVMCNLKDAQILVNEWSRVTCKRCLSKRQTQDKKAEKQDGEKSTNGRED